MAPDTDPIQFPRQVWQAVSDQARQCLVERHFCPEQSRIENLRCVRFESEKETAFGSQLWFFEAVGIDESQRRHVLYGALEYSVQYGLLEAGSTAIFEDAEERRGILKAEIAISASPVWRYASTRFWVRMACLGVIITAMMWVTILISYLTKP
jgi:hypothetical protein